MRRTLAAAGLASACSRRPDHDCPAAVPPRRSAADITPLAGGAGRLARRQLRRRHPPGVPEHAVRRRHRRGQRAQRPRGAARPRRPAHQQPARVRRDQDRRRPGHQVQPDHGQPLEPRQRRRRTSTRSRPSCPPARSRASRAATSGTYSPATAQLGDRADPAPEASSTRRRRPTPRPRRSRCSRRRWRSSGTTSPLGDVSPYADFANGHMYPGGYKPSNEVSQITTAIRGSIPADQAADHHRGRLPQRAEHDQRSPAGARGRGRGLHAAGAARALPPRARSASTPTSCSTSSTTRARPTPRPTSACCTATSRRSRRSPR